MFKTTLVIGCNHTGCKKTYEKTGESVTRAETVHEAEAKGWQFVNAAEQYCPDHRTGGKANGKDSGKAAKSTKAKAKGKTMKSAVSGKKGPKVFEVGKGAEA